MFVLIATVVPSIMFWCWLEAGESGSTTIRNLGAEPVMAGIHQTLKEARSLYAEARLVGLLHCPPHLLVSQWRRSMWPGRHRRRTRNHRGSGPRPMRSTLRWRGSRRLPMRRTAAPFVSRLQRKSFHFPASRVSMARIAAAPPGVKLQGAETATATKGASVSTSEAPFAGGGP